MVLSNKVNIWFKGFWTDKAQVPVYEILIQPSSYGLFKNVDFMATGVSLYGNNCIVAEKKSVQNGKYSSYNAA